MARFEYLLPLALAATLLCGGVASASTYYVDFANGDNAADGRSQRTAWKHTPGDANATDNPAAVRLAPGDTIIFRGGVAYHGSIRMRASGAEGNPITLDANTAGTFGEGRAILDGGRVIENWQRCTSPDQAGGNPRWRDIFFADIDVDISPNVTHGEVVVHRQAPRDKQAPWQRVILIDGDRQLLPIAQSPKPSDPFYPDLPRDFYRSEHRMDVREAENITVLTDEANLTQSDPNHFDGMMIGVHGGNNHVYFATVDRFDPATHQVTFARFRPSTYPQTRYAFYNSIRLIENPGEWSIAPIGDGRSRVHFLPDGLEGERPENIGYPVFPVGISIDGGASHIRIRGFLIQRYSGGAGGIAVSRNNPRARGIAISGCEIRFVAGHAGIGPHHADDILIENCTIHRNPGWTSGIFLNRINNYVVRNSRLDQNSGSGIRHYECQNGHLHDNAVLNHHGMHATGINVYEGCENVVIERNYVHRNMTINRNAENIVIRNNVIDGQGASGHGLAMWNSGRTRGRALRNIQVVNNTFVNLNHSVSWSAGLLVQQRGSPSPPEGLVVRNNILDRMAEGVQGTIENNIYTREVEARFMGPGCQVVTDLNVLFRDPANGDFRRRPGGPAMDVGADIPPPTPRVEGR